MGTRSCVKSSGRPTAADSARPRPVDEACTDLRESAKRAVENLAAAKVMKVSMPIHASLHAVPPASLRCLDDIPGINYRDDTLTFVTNDLREAYDGLVKIVGLTGIGYMGLLQETIGSRPDAAEIFRAFQNAVSQRWFDQESGRYQRPEPSEGVATGLRRFHGYR